MGGDDEREPGAHAGHRHPRVVAGGGRHLRQVGGAGHRRSGRSPRPTPTAAAACASATASTARCWPTCRPRRSPTTRRSTTGPAPRRAADAAARRSTGRRPTDCAGDLLALLRSARWVYRQYDHQLFLNTVAGPGGDAALLRLAGPGLPRVGAGRRRHDGLQPAGVRARPAGRHGAGARRGVPTWPASGPRRSRWSTASTSATRSTPRSCGSSRSASTAWPRRAGRLSLPVIGGQRQPLQRERRVPTSTRRRCSGCSGSSTPCAARPPGLAWSDGDAIVLLGVRAATRRVRTPGGHALGHRARATTAAGTCPTSTSRRTPRCAPSSPASCGAGGGAGRGDGRPLVHAVHDVSGGGLAVALAEMAAAAGCGGVASSCATRPSSSPSCRRASWWPPATPTCCAPGRRRVGIPRRRPGPGRGGPPRAREPGRPRRRTPWRGRRGRQPGLGRWANRDGAGPVREWVPR